MPSTTIAEAEAELAEWTSGGRSHWNDLHGSVTGDYVGMFAATANADAAQINFLISKITGLRALEGAQVPEKTEVDSRIEAWNRVVDHSFWEDCFGTGGSLIDAMIAKLDRFTPYIDPQPWIEHESGTRFSQTEVEAENQRGRCWRGLAYNRRTEAPKEDQQ